MLEMLSNSESEMFITQSSFSGSTAIELLENKFEFIFAGSQHEQASSLTPFFPLNNQSCTQPFRQLIRGLHKIFPPKRTKESKLM